MTLALVSPILTRVLQRQMAVEAWIADQTIRAQKVAAFRNYYDGDHPANMTAEMRKALRVRRAAGASEFNDNYCQIIVDTMADRCNLDRIESDNDVASAWAQEVLDLNRVDGLQGDVHEAAIRDADTFLMVSWDNDEQRVKFTHELAYDGRSGVLALYKSDDVAEMAAAIKIWNITADGGTIANALRVNVYLPDCIHKFISRDGQQFESYIDEYTDAQGVAEWTDRAGQPLGVPIYHFRNRGRQNYGLSELENAIPLQDALNRILHSMVMTAELTAFQVRWAKGFTPPAEVTPGMWVTIGGEGLTADDVVDLGVLKEGDMSQLLSMADHLAFEIGKVTRTPAPEFMGGDNASGEALKQRSIGLIGKVKRFEVKAGNAWENVMDMAWKVQDAYGSKRPPAYTRFYARWADPEIRNDQVAIDNALKVKDAIGDREFLRIIAPIYGWDESKIDQILAEKQDDNAKRLDSLAGSLPDFGNFNMPPDMADAMPPNMPMQQEVPIS